MTLTCKTLCSSMFRSQKQALPNLPFLGEELGINRLMFLFLPLKGFRPPMTFPSPDNGGTEGGVKTIEEPKGV